MANKSIFEKEKLSLWLKDGISQNLTKLKSDVSCDICIVGGGITGITTAYILSKLKFDVILIDSATPIHLTSGNTTAKFTFQHDLIYSEIIENYGIEEAQLYYEAQIKGMEFVRSIISDYNIQCDFQHTYAMIYAENDEQFKEIEMEYDAYNQLNIPCELVSELPYGITGVGGLKVYNQFCLNPVKYCSFLIDRLKENNVRVYENTNAVDLTIDDNSKVLITEDHFNVGDAKYRWSAQDYQSPDKIPYIGKMSSKYKDIFVATGFKKWGMSNSAFAGILLSTLIADKDSKFTELFSPSRKDILDNLGEFMKANLNVAKELIKGKVLPDEVKLKDIGNDEGGIIKYKGNRVGAYRDKYGKLFLVDSKCTHLGCELEYNNAERSFDCPCHGSRFTYEGKILEGPAVLDLKRIDE